MKRIMIVIMVVILTLSLFAHIKNPDRPLKGKWDFQMKKMWEVERAGDYYIAVVQNLAAAKDGRIYILDQKNFKIYIFSKEGQFISAFGQQGEGPGEIRRFFGGDQLFVMENSISILDLSKIHYFDLDGTYKKSALYPLDQHPRAFLSEEVYISAPTVISLGAKGQLLFYHVDNKSQKMIAEYSIYEKATDSQGGQFRRSIVIDTITPQMFVTCGKGKVYYGMSTSYEITTVDETGKKTGSFSIDGRERKNVSKKFLAHLGQELINDGDRPDVIKRILKALPKKASFFWKISADRNGLVYIFISDPDPDSANLQALDIFSPEGKFLYSSEIKIEEGLKINTIYLQDELLLMAVENEEGTVKVAKYLVKPPAL